MVFDDEASTTAQELLTIVRNLVEATEEAAGQDSSDDGLSLVRTISARLYWRCTLLPPVVPTSDAVASRRVADDSELEALERGLLVTIIAAEKRRIQRIRLPEQIERVRISEPDILGLAEHLVIVYDHVRMVHALAERGESQEAMWLCRFGFWSEWGEPQLSALRILHILVNPVELIFFS